jgi:hypothetical protein
MIIAWFICVVLALSSALWLWFVALETRRWKLLALGCGLLAGVLLLSYLGWDGLPGALLCTTVVNSLAWRFSVQMRHRARHRTNGASTG